MASPATITEPLPGTPALPGARKREPRVIQLPISATEWAALQAPFPISETKWEQMMAVLKAMKPALVNENNQE